MTGSALTSKICRVRPGWQRRIRGTRYQSTRTALLFVQFVAGRPVSKQITVSKRTHENSENIPSPWTHPERAHTSAGWRTRARPKTKMSLLRCTVCYLDKACVFPQGVKRGEDCRVAPKRPPFSIRRRHAPNDDGVVDATRRHHGVCRRPVQDVQGGDYGQQMSATWHEKQGNRSGIWVCVCTHLYLDKTPPLVFVKKPHYFLTR